MPKIPVAPEASSSPDDSHTSEKYGCPLLAANKCSTFDSDFVLWQTRAEGHIIGPEYNITSPLEACTGVVKSQDLICGYTRLSQWFGFQRFC